METYEDYLKRQLAAKETDDTVSLEGVTVPKICGSMKPFKFTGTTKGYELTLTPVLKSQVRMSDITPILRVVVARLKNDDKSIKAVRGTIVISYDTKFKKSQATDNLVSGLETKYAELVARAIRDINHVINGASLGTSSPRVFRVTTPKAPKAVGNTRYTLFGENFTEADIPTRSVRFGNEILYISGRTSFIKFIPKVEVTQTFLQLLSNSSLGSDLVYKIGKDSILVSYSKSTVISSILMDLTKDIERAASNVKNKMELLVKAGAGEKTLSPDKKKLTSVSMLKKYKETGELPPMTKENFETILKSLLRKSK